MYGLEVEFLFKVILLVLDYLKLRTLRATQCLDTDLRRERIGRANLSNILVMLRFIYALLSGQCF